jgi:hypothetical protein
MPPSFRELNLAEAPFLGTTYTGSLSIDSFVILREYRARKKLEAESHKPQEEEDDSSQFS